MLFLRPNCCINIRIQLQMVRGSVIQWEGSSRRLSAPRPDRNRSEWMAGALALSVTYRRGGDCIKINWNPCAFRSHAEGYLERLETTRTVPPPFVKIRGWGIRIQVYEWPFAFWSNVEGETVPPPCVKIRGWGICIQVYEWPYSSRNDLEGTPSTSVYWRKGPWPSVNRLTQRGETVLFGL